MDERKRDRNWVKRKLLCVDKKMGEKERIREQVRGRRKKSK